MSPLGYTPTRTQAEAVAAYLPRIEATRDAGLLRRATLARDFMDALFDCSFVLAGDFLRWQGVRAWLGAHPSRADGLDVTGIQVALTQEVLSDFEIEGPFLDFVYGPVLPRLLSRVTALYAADAQPEARRAA